MVQIDRVQFVGLRLCSGTESQLWSDEQTLSALGWRVLSTLRSNLRPRLGKSFPSRRLYSFLSQRLCLCDDEARAHSPQSPTLEDHGLRSSLPLKGPPLTVMTHSPQPPILGYLHCSLDDFLIWFCFDCASSFWGTTVIWLHWCKKI